MRSLPSGRHRETRHMPTIPIRLDGQKLAYIHEAECDGWRFATDIHSVPMEGNCGYDFAVAPDGSYARLHWTSLGKPFACYQTALPQLPGCFGEFRAHFPPPLTELCPPPAALAGPSPGIRGSLGLGPAVAGSAVSPAGHGNTSWAQIY